MKIYREPQVVECIRLPWTRSGQTSDTFDHWRSKWSNVSKVWYIRPLMFQVVQCIRSLMNINENLWKSYEKWSNVSDFRQSSDTFDHWRSKWSNVSKVVECIRLPSDFWYIRPRFENLFKWARLIHSTTLMKLHENPSKYNENLWKSTVNQKWSNVSDFWKCMEIYETHWKSNENQWNQWKSMTISWKSVKP